MRFRERCMEVSWPQDVVAAIGALQEQQQDVAWLDADEQALSDIGSQSLIAVGSLAEVVQPDARSAELKVGVARKRGESAWNRWREAHSQIGAILGIRSKWRWIGYVGFEMASWLERVPALRRSCAPMPLLRMVLPAAMIFLDHAARRAFAIVVDGLADALGAAATRIEDVIQSWEQACNARPDSLRSRISVPRLAFETAREEHEAHVRRAIEYIAAGDIYQVNLAHRLRLTGLTDPLSTYAQVRRANPAEFGALISWDGAAIASFSPELFLRVRGREVLTRPIKGTRPRSDDRVIDAANREALLASEKDAAELAMIVDLHRNDIGRVCDYGSVRVPHARRVEVHPSVFHTVADVTGRLADGRDALDLLMACFPAGSISGVPKIRALEIIGELEPTPRGVYSGAIGWLGFDGDALFNVAIRTLQLHGDTGYLHVGGGIVAESDLAAEYDETLAKAQGILRGLGISDATSPLQRTD